MKEIADSRPPALLPASARTMVLSPVPDSPPSSFPCPIVLYSPMLLLSRVSSIDSMPHSQQEEISDVNVQNEPLTSTPPTPTTHSVPPALRKLQKKKLLDRNTPFFLAIPSMNKEDLISFTILQCKNAILPLPTLLTAFLPW